MESEDSSLREDGCSVSKLGDPTSLNGQAVRVDYAGRLLLDVARLERLNCVWTPNWPNESVWSIHRARYSLREDGWRWHRSENMLETLGQMRLSRQLLQLALDVELETRMILAVMWLRSWRGNIRIADLWCSAYSDSYDEVHCGHGYLQNVEHLLMSIFQAWQRKLKDSC